MSEKNIKSFEELLKDTDWQITDENRIQRNYRGIKTQ